MSKFNIGLLFVLLSGVSFVVSEWSEIQERIIGGTLANGTNFGYQVSVQSSLQCQSHGHVCGGALVKAKYVVTAASCVVQKLEDSTLATENPVLIRVHVGLVDLDNTSSLANVVRIIPHPDYNPDTRENDIAVLELAIEMVEYGSPLEVATSEPAAETSCDVNGWGINSTTSTEFQNLLLTTKVPLILNEACLIKHQSLGTDFNITSKMVCAGSGTDVCLGDNGAPLVCGGKLTGLATFNSCTSSVQAPTVFTRISQYSDWIAKTSGGACEYLPTVMTVAILMTTQTFIAFNNFI